MNRRQDRSPRLWERFFNVGTNIPRRRSLMFRFDNCNKRLFHRRLVAGVGSVPRRRTSAVPLGQDAAAVHNDHAIAVFRLFHEVCRDDHGHPCSASEVMRRQNSAAPADRRRRWARPGTDLRLVQQRRRHCQPLLVSARNCPLVNDPIGASRIAQRPFDCVRAAVTAQAVALAKNSQVLQHRELAVERELLGHVSDALPGRSRASRRSTPLPGASRRWPAAVRTACERSSSCPLRWAPTGRRSRRG